MDASSVHNFKKARKDCYGQLSDKKKIQRVFIHDIKLISFFWTKMSWLSYSLGHFLHDMFIYPPGLRLSTA